MIKFILDLCWRISPDKVDSWINDMDYISTDSAYDYVSDNYDPYH